MNEIKNSVSSSVSTDVTCTLDSFLINIWPFKQGTSADYPENPYFEVGGPLCYSDFKKSLLDFRIHKTEVPEVTSLNIFHNDLPAKLPLLQQSIKLNCLSANIKREESKHLYKRPGRYEANFLNSQFQTSSLRNHVLVLYLAKEFKTLYSFLLSYFPGLDENAGDVSESTEPGRMPCAKRQKKNSSIRSVSVDKSVLEKSLKHVESVTSSMYTDPVPLFNTFCFQLLQHGKLTIQSMDDSGDIVCIMNDYSATDGSFRETEFVFTSKSLHKTGNYKPNIVSTRQRPSA